MPRRERAPGDDGGIQAEALRDVDARGSARDADFQLIGRLERGFVETDGGVEDSGGVGGVDLERSVMRGNDSEAADGAEMAGDSDGESCAFFGIGGGAEFVEQDEGVGGGGAGDEIDVGDVGGEGGKILLDGLVVADVGEHSVEDRKLGAIGGDGQAGLGHEGEEADGFQGDGFASGVGAGDDELATSAFEFDGDGDYR